MQIWILNLVILDSAHFALMPLEIQLSRISREHLVTWLQRCSRREATREHKLTCSPWQSAFSWWFRNANHLTKQKPETPTTNSFTTTNKLNTGVSLKSAHLWVQNSKICSLRCFALIPRNDCPLPTSLCTRGPKDLYHQTRRWWKNFPLVLRHARQRLRLLPRPLADTIDVIERLWKGWE